MSNLPQQSTLNQYVADGIATVYNYTYLVPEQTDMSVYVTLAGNVANPSADIQVLGVNYVVNNTGNVPGGTVSFLIGSTPPLGALVTLVRTVQYSLDTEFVQARNINGQNLDNAFERLLLLTQQLNTQYFERALSYAINSYLPAVPTNILPIITNIDNQIWKSQGGAVIASLLVENPDSSTLRSDLANSTPIGNGSAIVGYYDANNASSTTVSTFLNYQKIFGSDVGSVNDINIIVPNSTIPAGVLPKGSEIIITGIQATNTALAPTVSINGAHTAGIFRAAGVPAQPGDIPINGNITLVSDGSDYILLSSSLSASALPSGAFMDFAGPIAPVGYLVCDSSAVSRAVYSSLFSAIGTTWGIGDGSTTFNLPPPGVVRMGAGGPIDSTIGNVVGNTGGERRHTQTTAEIGAHVHTPFQTPGTTGPYTFKGGVSTGGSENIAGAGTIISEAVSTASTGSSTPFNVIQPSMIVLTCIKI